MKPWLRWGLLWAAFMTLFMTFVEPYILEFVGLGDDPPKKFSIAKFIINILVFTIAGLILAYRNSKKTKAPKKQIDA